MSDLYSDLYASKGKSYFDDQVKDYSLLKIYPDIDNTKSIKGNSRVSGDIDLLSQHAIIDMLITIGARYKLTYKELSYVLLCAHVESGFNPDAAAGTTSAAGIGQATVAFVEYTLRNSSKWLGFTLDIRGEKIFDAELGCYALVFSFLRARDLVSDHYKSSEDIYWRWIYYLHHDGIGSLKKYNKNEHILSADAIAGASKILAKMPVIEQLLKTTQVAVSFKLSTGDDTPVANKEYVAAVSLSQDNSCPNIVSSMNSPLIFFKGKTDSEGKTEAINALAGAEIVFTILRDNYKKLALSGDGGGTQESNSGKEDKKPLRSSGSTKKDDDTYKVKSGDTLSVIAKSHGTTVDNLAKLNHLPDANVLHVGQVLKLSEAKKNDAKSNPVSDFISRYVSEGVKQAIMKYLGIESGNIKAAIAYSKSHIVLPHGSTSADKNKSKNVVHLKTTTKSAAVKKNQSPPEKHKTDDKNSSKSTFVINEIEPIVKFAVSHKLESLVSSKSLEILKGIMKTAGVHKITITSTLRTAQKQVDAMYTNMQSKGIQSQLNYYAAPGRAVVRAGVDAGGNDISKKEEVKLAMINKVIALQGEGKLVSRHCVSEEMYATRNVFDISKNFSTKESVQLAFDKALNDYAESNDGFKFISPFKHSGEPAFHVEIEQ
ncbi:lytic transglycosylase [Lelliottia wanjuensis]|uniref:lytic transglycosylase n=1 Tax=Lelliottia wanjuensis TaxID=3050585 RepID=UPI00254C9879|nr:LysM peptidoglycan-binding domain-containing protein [Lelliottia sp. V104_15]MDK9605692.1 LysM peptidoglycan-binding domain-containing protein [Lelliottia sp. V104_15]